MQTKRFYFFTCEELWRWIDARDKWAFGCGFLATLLTHFLLFVHGWVNHDGIANVVTSDDMITSGRWALYWASLPSTCFTLPWLQGILCAVYMGLLVLILARVMEIRSRAAIVALAELTVAAPCVINLFFYFFTADAYILAMILAALSVWLTKLYRWGWIPAAVLFGVSIGIYQSYLGYAIMLVLLLLIRQLLDRQRSVLDWLKQVLHQLLMGVVGYIVYLLGLNIRLALTHQQLSSYQGIDEMGKLDPAQILPGIGAAYTDFWGYFFGQSYYSYKPDIIKIIYALLLIGTVAWSVYYLAQSRSKDRLPKTLLLACCLAAVPIAFSIMRILAPSAYQYLLMIPQSALVPVLFLSLCGNTRKEKAGSVVRAVASWGTILIVVPLSCYFFLLAQYSYAYLQTINETIHTLSIQMMDRAAQTDGFTEDTPVFIIGVPDEKVIGLNAAQNPFVGYTVAQTNMVFSEDPGYNDALWKNWLNYWKQANWTAELTTEMRENILASDEFQAMGTWPSQDSVQMVQGVLVVKFNNT